MYFGYGTDFMSVHNREPRLRIGVETEGWGEGVWPQLCPRLPINHFFFEFSYFFSINILIPLIIFTPFQFPFF